MHNRDVKQETITALFVLSCCLIVALAFKTFLEFKYRETIKAQKIIINEQNEMITKSLAIADRCQILNKQILDLKGDKNEK